MSTFEQRHSKRRKEHRPVSVWHPKASRFFNGRSDNVSESGVLLVLPMKIPVQEGQDLKLNFLLSDLETNEQDGEKQPKSAKVVRIDRQGALASATIKVGLQFEPAEALAEK